ncbi:MAG: tRNA pseudouridine(13) synthase TruD [candidate division WOR-3 bacterium]|nr:tRNA pseudouridine(13) synthase TruD [candidate division WOR-3 bacterium]
MKIKCLPDDFYVEEKVNISFNQSGPYAIYKLEKKFWDTFDLLDYLSRKYRLKDIGRAGIKDRYSHSIQFISIKNLEKLDIAEKNFKLSFVGTSPEPITINSLLGNAFQITIRDLNQKEIEYINQNLKVIKTYGFPNYYDEQRMGSGRAQKGFIAQKLIFQHYNGALKLYLATPSKFDDSKTRRLKKYLLENWGNWQKCLKAPYDLGQFRYPLHYLQEHPKDFKGAIKTIRRDLLEMFINAYQAYLWNETLKKLIQNRKIKYFSVKYRFGELYFYEKLSSAEFNYLRDLVVPAPSYKLTLADFNNFSNSAIPTEKHKSKSHYAEIKSAMEQVLSEESREINQNISLKDLKIHLGIKGLFFKPYERKAIVLPKNITITEPMNDDLYPKKYKQTVSFFLPKGSYATILIKRITSI